MDFIERVFGISPDGGSGALEALVLLVPVALIVFAIMWARSRARE